MIYIAAVDSHWAIGQKGQLLVTIPQDQKRFRDMTLGKVIVMGRKTLDTLPGGQPLYGRRNVILSRDPEYRVKGADVCHSVEECLELLKNYGPDDIYIIGGESISASFCPTAAGQKLPGLILHIPQMHIFPTWKSLGNGR